MNVDRDYLAAGLALGGLSDEDRAFAQSLADTDADFRAEVDAYAETIASTALSDAPQTVSIETAEAIRAIPHLAAQTADEASDDGASDDGAVDDEASAGGKVSEADEATDDGASDDGEIIDAGARFRRTPRRSRAWIGWAAAAACFVVLVGVGVDSWQLRARQGELEHSLETARSELSDSRRLLDSTDLRTETVSLPAGGSVTVLSSVDAQLIQVVPRGVEAPPADRSLQLWVIGDSEIRSAGLLTDATRSITDQHFGNGSRLGITVEPAGGSPQPTTDPIAAIAL